MAIYNLNGQILSSGYDLYGTELDHAYDSDGNTVFTKESPLPPSDPYIEGRTLLFEDTFDGGALNSENWSYEIGNVRNNELQFYRSQNVVVEDSNLVITAKRETHLNKEWTSGSITGQLKKSWLYGRFEAKIRFPNVVGAFGAFWTLGANHWIQYTDDDGNPTEPLPSGSVRWPACGEIDITETIPGNANTAQANLWKYSGGSLGTGRSASMVSSDWHIYSMEWTSEYIAMLLDGTEYKRWTFSNYASEQVQAYHLAQYIILNLAVGASGGTPASSTNEMKMYVDWVRVYAPLNLK